MRNFLAFASLLAFAAAPAGAATRNFGITGFEKVRIEGPFKVTLQTGVAPFARATGPAPALDRLAIDMRGNTLVVHSNMSAWGDYTGRDSGPVEIFLGTHDLASAWLNGSGTIAIDKVKSLSFDLSVQGSGGASVAQLDVDQMNANVGGTSSAMLAGRVAKLTAVVRGMSSIDASALRTKDATIGAEGAATVKATVTNAATVDGNGPLNVAFAGRPACTLRVRGSASVSGCK